LAAFHTSCSKYNTLPLEATNWRPEYATLLAPIEVLLDQLWGLDHGIWSVLIHAFPKADVPVVQLSMDATQPPAVHYAIGQKLATLRDQGVLVIGSGNVVHNLAAMRPEENVPPLHWAACFNASVREHIERADHSALINYRQWGNDAERAVPTPEHYLPLLYVIGQQGDDEIATCAIDGIEFGSIGRLSTVIGPISASRQSGSV
jgi:4,5-DOPA dioxygenase extradiol